MTESFEPTLLLSMPQLQDRTSRGPSCCSVTSSPMARSASC
jgi:hypothetical protein